MKLGLTENQYKKLLTLLQEQAEPPAAEPEKGTSDKQSGGQGYPQVGKWESGVTRGPGNQVGVTKWADVVGAKLNRGKANQLKETEYTKENLLLSINEQTPKKRTGNVIIEPMGDEWEKNPINQTKTYKTFWGETIQIKDDGSTTVTLWTPTLKRIGVDGAFTLSDNNKIEIKKQIPWYELDFIKKLPKDKVDDYVKKKGINLETNIQTIYQDPPTETYLRKVFPDGTIKSIKDNKTKEIYGSVIERKDVNDSVNYNKKLNKDDSPMGTIINPGLFREPHYQWVPVYGYFYSPHVENNGQSWGQRKSWIKQYTVNKEYDNFIKQKYDPKTEIQRFYQRLSPSGKNVPIGMNPNLYDEYLYRKELLERYEKWNSTPDVPTGPHKPQYTSVFSKEEWEELQKMFNYTYGDYYNKITNVAELNAQYISPLGEGGVPEFSYGISPKARDAFFRYKKSYENQYEPRIKYLQQKIAEMTHNSSVLSANGRMSVPTKKYDQGYDKLKTELDALVKERDLKYQELKMLWGYDYWKPSFMGKSFDEVWDKWGGLISFGSNIILLVVSGGLGNVAKIGVQTAFKVATLTTIDVALNGFIATYQLSRGEESEAAISMLCAFLPVVKYFGNIGKIDPKVAVELAKKIKASTGFMDSVESFNNFILFLSEEERYVLRNLMSLPRETLSRASVEILSDLQTAAAYAEKFKKAGALIPSTGIKTWGPNALKELGLELGVPLVAGVANGITQFIVNSTPRIEWNVESINQVNDIIKTFLDNVQGMTEDEVIMYQFSVLDGVENDQILKGNLNNADKVEDVINYTQDSMERAANEYSQKTPEQRQKDFQNDIKKQQKIKDAIEFLNKINQEDSVNNVKINKNNLLQNNKNN
jgi:hypothetical protein